MVNTIRRWGGSAWDYVYDRNTLLPLAGGTMTGPLTLAADPAQPMQAATKSYVDTTAFTQAAADLRFVNVVGDTMTGPLILNVAGNFHVLRLMNANNTPFIELRSNDAATRYGYLQGGPTETIMQADVGAARVRAISDKVLLQSPTNVDVELGNEPNAKFRILNYGFEKAWIDKDGGAFFGNTSEYNSSAASGGFSNKPLNLRGLFASDLSFYASRFDATGPVGSVLRGTVAVDGYEDMYLITENLTAGNGAIHFAPKGVEVLKMESAIIRPLKPTYSISPFRIAGGVQSLILTNDANGPYVGLYGGATPDSIGTRKGFMGFTSATGMLVNNETDGGYVRITTAGTGNIDFYPGNAYQARLTAAGDYIVGKTAVDSTTIGCAVTGNGRFYSTTNNTTAYSLVANIIAAQSGDRFADFRRSDTAIGFIYTTAALTGVAYSTTSDMHHKGSVQEIDDDEALELIESLHPVAFQWRYDENGEPSPEGSPKGPFEHGFLAQELADVLPGAVTPGKGTWDEHKQWRETESEDTIGPYEPWMSDNSKLIPDLTAAVQALIRKVKALEGAT